MTVQLVKATCKWGREYYIALEDMVQLNNKLLPLRFKDGTKYADRPRVAPNTRLINRKSIKEWKTIR